MNLCVLFVDGWGVKQDQENLVVIIDLWFVLIFKFMIFWYGGLNFQFLYFKDFFLVIIGKYIF